MKKIIALFIILLIVLKIDVDASSYTTSKNGSSQGYTITARAVWEYSTGLYAGKGAHSIVSKPSAVITSYDIEYLLTHVDSHRYTAHQYFRPVYIHLLVGTISYGNSFGITLNSSGPY